MCRNLPLLYVFTFINLFNKMSSANKNATKGGTSVAPEDTNSTAYLLSPSFQKILLLLFFLPENHFAHHLKYW